MAVLSPKQIIYSTELARVIDERGLSRPWLAQQAGIHLVVLGYLVRGQRPMSQFYAAKLSQVLGVPPERLIGVAS